MSTTKHPPSQTSKVLTQLVSDRHFNGEPKERPLLLDRQPIHQSSIGRDADRELSRRRGGGYRRRFHVNIVVRRELRVRRRARCGLEGSRGHGRGGRRAGRSGGVDGRLAEEAVYRHFSAGAWRGGEEACRGEGKERNVDHR